MHWLDTTLLAFMGVASVLGFVTGFFWQVARIVGLVKGNSPQAMAASKALVRAVDKPLDDAVIAHTAREIARQRASADGVEGLTSFLEKRKPRWAPKE